MAATGISERKAKRQDGLMAWHRADPTCQRLETIPGIGFITATALAATRKCSVPAGSLPLGSAWCQRSTRPAASSEWAYRKWETAICGISLSLEPLPSFGIRGTRRLPSASGQINCWSDNQPVLVTVAVANKMARIAWAVMAREESYRPMPAGA